MTPNTADFRIPPLICQSRDLALGGGGGATVVGNQICFFTNFKTSLKAS